MSAREALLAVAAAGLLSAAGADARAPGASRGTRRLQRPLALEATGATSANVSIGDIDRDGHLDILLVKGRHWPLEEQVLLGRGDGTFRPAYPLGAAADRSYTGALVDVDRDGDLDVVVSNDKPDAKLVHLNDGSGRFAPGGTFGAPEWPTRQLRIVDLDGDSLPDAILANRHGRSAGPSYLCFGVAGGRFASACTPLPPGSATSIAVADFNGDQAPDLVVPHRDGGQGFVYLNDGRGGFAQRRPFGPPDAEMRSAEPADMDGDGRLDLVVIDERTGPAILHGRADGSFGAAVPLGAGGATPYAIAVADLDRNGRPDVIVGFVRARPIVHFNDAPGTLTAVPFGDDEGTAYGFAVADIDEDGLLDVAMARSDARNMLYFGASDAAR